MKLVITPLDGKNPVTMDGKDAALSWGQFGGPLLLDTPHNFPSRLLARYRAALVQAFGTWGLCWEGYMTRITPTGLEASGPNWALQEPAMGMVFCDTQTSVWKPYTHSGADEYLKPEVNGPYLRINSQPGAAIVAGDLNGLWRTYPWTTKARLTFDYVVPSTSWAWRVRYGTYAPQSNGACSASLPLQWTSSGTSGSASVDITVGHDVVLLSLDRIGGSATSVLETSYVHNLKVYTVVDAANNLITSPTLAAIVQRCVRWGPSWLQKRDAGTYAAIGTAIEPFQGTMTPLGGIAEALRYEQARFMWRITPTGCRPVLDALPTTPRYVVDLRDKEVEWEPGGWDADEWYNRAQVLYKDEEGLDKTVTRTVSTGYLARLGYYRDWSVKVDTTSQTQAERIGDMALAELAADRYAGTVTTPRVFTTGGAPVPLEHLVPGERILLVGYDGVVAPRLIESKLQGGRASLTLDTASGALDATLARLTKRET
jgi:hypothetical protein